MTFDNLQNLGIGIIGFAITIGIGVIVLQKFGNAVGGDANTTVAYLNTQLGSTGLAGWIPAIIALSVGMMFLGYFLVNRGGKSY